MQAVQAGVVGLDEPVRSQLQEFSVADPAATIEITPRHLLTHTSGIEGDHLIDTGWNNDALSRYVATLAGLGQLHPTDEAYSFCNTGLRGARAACSRWPPATHFDRVLRRRLVRPLGVPHDRHAAPARAPAQRGRRATARPSPIRRRGSRRWSLTRSNGPMGGILAPADELLTFAALHLDEGRAAGGVDLLTPASIAAMQAVHADTPLPGEAQALGWTVAAVGRRRPASASTPTPSASAPCSG